MLARTRFGTAARAADAAFRRAGAVESLRVGQIQAHHDHREHRRSCRREQCLPGSPEQSACRSLTRSETSDRGSSTPAALRDAVRRVRTLRWRCNGDWSKARSGRGTLARGLRARGTARNGTQERTVHGTHARRTLRAFHSAANVIVASAHLRRARDPRRRRGRDSTAAPHCGTNRNTPAHVLANARGSPLEGNHCAPPDRD